MSVPRLGLKDDDSSLIVPPVEKTRSDLANKFLTFYFWIIIGALAVSFVYIYTVFLKTNQVNYDLIKDVILALSGLLSGPLGLFWAIISRTKNNDYLLKYRLRSR